jgi:hypothetical protein
MALIPGQNGSPAERNKIYANLSAEWWITVRAIDRAPHDSDPGRRKVDRAAHQQAETVRFTRSGKARVQG